MQRWVHAWCVDIPVLGDHTYEARHMKKCWICTWNWKWFCLTFTRKDCENCRGCVEKYGADEGVMVSWVFSWITRQSWVLATEEHSDLVAKEQASGKAACIRGESRCEDTCHRMKELTSEDARSVGEILSSEPKNSNDCVTKLKLEKFSKNIPQNTEKMLYLTIFPWKK